MAISQLTSRILVPKTPKIAAYSNTSAVSATYYTLVNITNTRGKVLKTTMSSWANNSFQNIRFTVDGVQTVISGTAGTSNGSLGLQHNTSGGTLFFPFESIDYYTEISFFSSLQVELMQNSGSTTTIIGSINYCHE